MSDGGDLRTQLESTLAENKKLKDSLQGYVVREVASEYALVKPEDLTGLDLDEAKERAEELQAERTEQQVTLLKAAGLDEERIERVLSGGVLDDETEELDPDVAKLARQQGGSGRRPPKVDEKQFSGPSAIKAHFKQESADKQ